MSNKKIVFIIHGWSDSPRGSWFPWLKTELRKRGFIAYVPKMPNTNTPKIKAWISKLRKVAQKANENTYFVGHSIGCQAIMRYLGGLPKRKKIGGAIFVAGGMTLTNQTHEEKPIARPWLETKINFAKVKKSAKKFVAVFSDNDPYVTFSKNSKIFKQKLGAEIILEHKKGHFFGSDGVTKLPIVLKALLRMT